MFVPLFTLSLATSCLVRFGAALEIDVKDQDSVKDVAKTLAGGIVATYKQTLDKQRIPGLFADPYYWWEAGAVFGSLIDYSFLTGDNQYNDLVQEAMKHQIGEGDAFMPANQSKSLGNDDQATWGLAAMAAAEAGFPTSKLGNLTWIDLAKNVFDTQTRRWDSETCEGGLRWQVYQFNNGYSYKNSISSGDYLLLATRLAKFTGNVTYQDEANKVYGWTQHIDLMDDSFHVYDGADADTDCKNIGKIQWSANNAVYLEAAAHMYNVTTGNEKWEKEVKGLLNATTNVFMKDDKVLYEVACELNGKCNTDQRAYKGLTARSLARAAVSAPFIADTVNAILEASAQGAAKGCSGEGKDLKCSLKWTDGTGSSGLGESFGALAVTQGLLAKDAKAVATRWRDINGTRTDASNDTTPSGSAKPAENEGAADGLAVSSGALAVVAFVAAAALL